MNEPLPGKNDEHTIHCTNICEVIYLLMLEKVEKGEVKESEGASRTEGHLTAQVKSAVTVVVEIQQQLEDTRDRAIKEAWSWGQVRAHLLQVPDSPPKQTGERAPLKFPKFLCFLFRCQSKLRFGMWTFVSHCMIS